MSKFLINIFLKNKDNDRKKVGYLGSITGIICNVFLFIIKLIVGINVNSVAVMADSFNNLSDVGTSAITFIGFKLSDKPADKEHPFGHGRTEYISAMIVSMVIILVGFELLKSSITRLINPEPVIFKTYAVYILIISIIIKLWLSKFNKNLNKIINSQTLEAASLDSLSDVLSTSCVLISIIAVNFTDFSVDGVVGIIVAGFILFNGISLTKSTLNMLLGSNPDPKLMENINNYIINFDGVKGVHDLIIHDYGPNTKMATVHIEISASLHSIAAHNIIDKIERKTYDKFGVILLIHFDPVKDKCLYTNKIKERVTKILDDFEEVCSIHDFRTASDGDVRTMIFDVVVDEKLSNENIKILKHRIIEKLSEHFETYQFVITIEKENIFIN